jgi:hypothetical protein
VVALGESAAKGHCASFPGKAGAAAGKAAAHRQALPAAPSHCNAVESLAHAVFHLNELEPLVASHFQNVREASDSSGIAHHRYRHNDEIIGEEGARGVTRYQ